jgi:hypothetical protein
MILAERLVSKLPVNHRGTITALMMYYAVGCARSQQPAICRHEPQRYFGLNLFYDIGKLVAQKLLALLDQTSLLLGENRATTSESRMASRAHTALVTLPVLSEVET